MASVEPHLPASTASVASVSSVEPDDVSDSQAVECLEQFRAQLRCFPFVYIPRSMTAVQLQRDRPFLWMCILSITAKSSAQQYAIGSKIRHILAEKVFVQHERGLDLLLGVLTFMGWANYHMGHQPFLSMYSHLLIGLVQDLGIDKAPSRGDEQHPMACLKFHGLIVKQHTSAVRTMEERRAALAAYLITSECVLQHLISTEGC